MKRHIPGLTAGTRNADDFLEGLFLVRVDHVNYRWHPKKPCFLIRFVILEPEELRSRCISGRSITPSSLLLLSFFATFSIILYLLYLINSLKALLNYLHILTSHIRSFLNLDGFAPAAEWESLSIDGHAGIQNEKKVSHDIQLHTD